MDVDEMAERAKEALFQLRHYAVRYSFLKKEGRRTHQQAKMIRRRIAEVRNWLDGIEIQLKEDEEDGAQ